MGLADIVSGLSSVSNLLLATPQATVGYQPMNAPVNNGAPIPNPPALLFNYEGEQSVSLQSDITDHYVEDNTAVQDQIALRPERVTTAGFIGELNNVPPNPTLAALQSIASKLIFIDAYTPDLSTTALDAYNAAVFAYETAAKALSAAASIVSTINGISNQGGESVIGAAGLVLEEANQNQQQTYFQLFYNYWRTRTLFLVQTPWAVFQNMAIENLRAIQDPNTQLVSTFEVTFKMIRFVSDIVVLKAVNNPANMQNRASLQASPENNLGPYTPPLSSLSLSNIIPGGVNT